MPDLDNYSVQAYKFQQHKNVQLRKNQSNQTHVESMSNGRVSRELTEPVNKHL